MIDNTKGPIDLIPEEYKATYIDINIILSISLQYLHNIKNNKFPEEREGCIKGFKENREMLDEYLLKLDNELYLNI